MVYLKSILVGLVAAILSVAIVIAVTMLMSLRQLASTEGIGSVTFNSNWIPGFVPLLIGVIAFAIGFAWKLRRSQ